MQVVWLLGQQGEPPTCSRQDLTNLKPTRLWCSKTLKRPATNYVAASVMHLDAWTMTMTMNIHCTPGYANESLDSTCITKSMNHLVIHRFLIPLSDYVLSRGWEESRGKWNQWQHGAKKSPTSFILEYISRIQHAKASDPTASVIMLQPDHWRSQCPTTITFLQHIRTCLQREQSNIW